VNIGGSIAAGHRNICTLGGKGENTVRKKNEYLPSQGLSKTWHAGYRNNTKVNEPPRGDNRRISEDWLEKNPSGLFDCSPSGAAEHSLFGMFERTDAGDIYQKKK
jgi:hypothetical protein